MFLKKEKIENKIFEKSNEKAYHDLIYILGSKKEIIKRNFLGGIARGVGIGIGVTIVTAIIVFLLRKIVMLNIPIIGEYISDIVDIVQQNKLR